MAFICPSSEKSECLVPPFSASIQKCISWVFFFCASLSTGSFWGWQEHLMSLLIQEYPSPLPWNVFSFSASKPSSWKCLWPGPCISLHQAYFPKPGSYSLCQIGRSCYAHCQILLDKQQMQKQHWRVCSQKNQHCVKNNTDVSFSLFQVQVRMSPTDCK